MVICFFGDSLTLGYGDSTGLGWPGRIAARLAASGTNATAYNLGVRKDSSVQMQHRWRKEAAVRRLEGEPMKLVFNFGVADVFNNVPAEMTMAAGVSMLTQARELGDTLLVGPLPVNDPDKLDRITSLSNVLEALAGRIGVPFLPVAKPMHFSFVYGQALNDGDGIHPVASGYAELADHLLAAPVMRTFLGLED